MKKKNKTILISIIVIIAMTLIILPILVKKEQTKNEMLQMCETIENDIKNKEKIILFIKPLHISIDSKETIEKIKENYPQNTFYTLKYSELKNKCIRKMLDRENIYNDIIKNDDTIAVLYNEGKYVGLLMGLDSYKTTERYFDEKNIIEKKEIIEEFSLEEYKNKIKTKEKYLLLIITDEKNKKEIDNLLKKYFQDYEYDIVNLNSEIGRKLSKEYEEKYKMINEYPRMLYFEKGNFIKSDDAHDELSIKIYKESMTS